MGNKKYLTTSKLAAKHGINSRKLYSTLSEWGWLTRKENDWVLTDLGKSKGGQVWSTNERGQFAVWPESISLDHAGNTSGLQQQHHAADEASEGEQYIAEYFDATGISYREEYVINELNDKFAHYRIADFYLPKFKVYLEFAGRWNRSSEDRARYLNKKQVYAENGIPCIWIYPDNLGVLHYIFHMRLESVLGSHKLETSLVRYRLGQFWKKDGGNFFGVGCGLFGLIYLSIPWSQNVGLAWFSGALTVYNLYHIASDLIRINKGKSVQISRLNKWEED